MVIEAVSKLRRPLEWLGSFSRRCLLRVLSVGPLPNHVAFIMDGNRRYAKKEGLEAGAGHKVGYSALMSILGYCYELGIKYVTVYAFSIDNFKRRPEEVQYLMDLMLEKIEELFEKQSIVSQYGVRVYFIGNLRLLNEPLRAAMEKLMSATSKNKRAVLLVCVAYASLDEIVHAVEESCVGKVEALQDTVNNGNDGVLRNGQESSWTPRMGVVGDKGRNGIEELKMQEQNPIIQLVDIERHMYMAGAPSPDVLIRSSGEMRLSNFLLWQTGSCPLYSLAALWPEIGLRHLVWTILDFQRKYLYLEKTKKRI